MAQNSSPAGSDTAQPGDPSLLFIAILKPWLHEPLKIQHQIYQGITFKTQCLRIETHVSTQAGRLEGLTIHACHVRWNVRVLLHHCVLCVHWRSFILQRAAAKAETSLVWGPVLMLQSICISLPDTPRLRKHWRGGRPKNEGWEKGEKRFKVLFRDLTLRNSLAVATCPSEQGGAYQHFITDVTGTHAPPTPFCGVANWFPGRECLLLQRHNHWSVSLARKWVSTLVPGDRLNEAQLAF